MAESCSISSPDTNDDKIASCERCKISLTEPEDTFMCKFCFGASEKSYRCQFCIVSHLRQLHEVTDFYGRDVGMCTKHRSLIVSVCTTCREMICMECFLSHSKHDCVDLKSYAAQLKRKVHSSLDDCITSTKIAAKLFEERNENFAIYQKVLPFQSHGQASEYFQRLVLTVTSEKAALMTFPWLDSLQKERDSSLTALREVERKEERLRSLLSRSNYALASELKDLPESSQLLDSGKIQEDENQRFQIDLERFQTEMVEWESELREQFASSIENFIQRINPSTIEWDLEELGEFCKQNYTRIAASDNSLCILDASGIGNASVELLTRNVICNHNHLERLILKTLYHSFSRSRFEIFSSPSGIALRRCWEKLTLFHGIGFDDQDIAIPTTENLIGTYTSDKGIVFANYSDNRIVFSGAKKFAFLFSQQPRYMQAVENLSTKIQFCAAVLVMNSPRIHLFMYTDSNPKLVKKCFDPSNFGMSSVDSILFTKTSENDAYSLLCWNLEQKRIFVIKSVINCEHFLPKEDNMISIQCKAKLKDLTVFKNDLFILTNDHKVLRKIDFLTISKERLTEKPSCPISRRKDFGVPWCTNAGTSK